MEFIDRNKSEEDINIMNPLVWAYIGDCIFELYIRNYLVNTTRQKTHMLHINTIKYVKAEAQAKILKKIEVMLTEEEQQIVKRGRNAENHHLPKNASLSDYTHATAFEALIGYLYLTKKDERLKEILKECIK